MLACPDRTLRRRVKASKLAFIWTAALIITSNGESLADRLEFSRDDLPRHIRQKSCIPTCIIEDVSVGREAIGKSKL